MANHNASNVRGVSNPTTKPVETTEPEPIAVTASISRPTSQAAKPGRKLGTSYIMLAQATVMIGDVSLSIPIWMSSERKPDGSGVDLTTSAGSLPRGVSVPDDLRSRIDETVEQTIAGWSDWDAACERAETLIMRSSGEKKPTAAAGRLGTRLVKPAKPEASAPAPA